MITRSFVIPALLVLGTAVIYLGWLGDAPAYLNRDELVYSLHAQTLADSGRDLTGEALPMYPAYPAQYGRPTFLQPMLIYVIAISLKVFPLSEVVVRLPMALAGIVDVLLVYFIALRLFSRQSIAIGAAALLALSPAHVFYSRLATDFLASVPFILGWLLCLVIYFRREQPRQLFIGGLLLGVGMYGYVGAYLLVPIYVLLTCVVLFLRRDPLARYGWLLAGVMLPTVIVLPWMLRHHVPFLEIVAHYQQTPSMDASTSGVLSAFFSRDLAARAASLYAGFLGLRFLFVDGSPRMAQPMAFFLLPVAGLLVVGMLRALTRRSLTDLLLLGGFFAAPLPASFVGEDLAIWRVMLMAPFGVLLAASGLHQMIEPESTAARRLAYATTFGTAIALAFWYPLYMPQATPLLRASVVPLALLVLTVLLRNFSLDRLPPREVAIVAAIVIVTFQVAVRLDLGTFFLVLSLLQVGLCLAAVIRGLSIDQLWGGPIAGVALVALASIELVNLHVDYAANRMDRVPAGVIVLATHCLLASIVFTLALGLARLLGSGSRVESPTNGASLPVAVALAIMVMIQLSYFHLSVASSGTRFFVITALFLAAIAFPLRIGRDLFEGRRLVQVAAVAAITIGAIQFVYFAVDYETRYRVFRSGQADGNVRAAWETLVEWARTRSVPVIYLAEPLPPFSLDAAYLRFYLIKHNRRDLLGRTTVGEPGREFDPERIRQLPADSVVIAGTSNEDEAAIERMVAAGELRKIQLAKAADGTSLLWILATSQPGVRSSAAQPAPGEPLVPPPATRATRASH